MIPEIKLKLKCFGCFEVVDTGVYFYTEQNFKIFVPTYMLENISKYDKYDKRYIK